MWKKQGGPVWQYSMRGNYTLLPVPRIAPKMNETTTVIGSPCRINRDPCDSLDGLSSQKKTRNPELSEILRFLKIHMTSIPCHSTWYHLVPLNLLFLYAMRSNFCTHVGGDRRPASTSLEGRKKLREIHLNHPKSTRPSQPLLRFRMPFFVFPHAIRLGLVAFWERMESGLCS